MTSSHEPQGGARERAANWASVASSRWEWLAHRGSWRWLAPCAAVALAVVVTVYIAGSHDNPRSRGAASASASPAESVRNHAVVAHRSSSSRTPEAAVAAMHMPRNLATALTRWDAGFGGSALAKVSNDLGNATQDAGIQLYSPMRLACSSLAAAVTAAKDGPPIPDTAMQKSYGLALNRLSAGATDCRAAISVYPYGDEDVKTYENPTLLHQSVSELAAGAKDLYQATVNINAAAHHGTSP